MTRAQVTAAVERDAAEEEARDANGEAGDDGSDGSGETWHHAVRRGDAPAPGDRRAEPGVRAAAAPAHGAGAPHQRAEDADPRLRLPHSTRSGKTSAVAHRFPNYVDWMMHPETKKPWWSNPEGKLPEQTSPFICSTLGWPITL